MKAAVWPQGLPANAGDMFFENIYLAERPPAVSSNPLKPENKKVETGSTVNVVNVVNVIKV
jgi:hypothetical protein